MQGFLYFSFQLCSDTIVFTRISLLPAIVCGFLSRLFQFKSLYWRSGCVEDANRLFGIKGWLDQFFVSLSIHAFSVFSYGPPSLIDYYQNIYRKKWSRILCLPNNVSSYFFRQRNRSPYHLPLATESFRIAIACRFSPVRET